MRATVFKRRPSLRSPAAAAVCLLAAAVGLVRLGFLTARGGGATPPRAPVGVPPTVGVGRAATASRVARRVPPPPPPPPPVASLTAGGGITDGDGRAASAPPGEDVRPPLDRAAVERGMADDGGSVSADGPRHPVHVVEGDGNESVGDARRLSAALAPAPAPLVRADSTLADGEPPSMPPGKDHTPPPAASDSAVGDEAAAGGLPADAPAAGHGAAPPPAAAVASAADAWINGGATGDGATAPPAAGHTADHASSVDARCAAASRAYFTAHTRAFRGEGGSRALTDALYDLRGRLAATNGGGGGGSGDRNGTVRAERPPLIVDVGANIGQGIPRWRAIYPRARLVLVEASPLTVAALRARIAAAPSLTDTAVVIAAAAAATAGHVRFRAQAGDGSNQQAAIHPAGVPLVNPHNYNFSFTVRGGGEGLCD
ncbi:hypothetical protein BU14_2441s0001 [Porphyra umbilicalis]|uniref:Uncharacterized protein n=1 Tax=Porphyra umbilicalis TaxID=2786 RepID=A0A1X6NJI9_PORUM|nr:hypothetical protein BU14_2441s0001 [Porphyra umbilicalis]|eukprot:OSX68646.1 hypothetical protein BU14_2441s0001 [Porphyra umbilicalis]